MGRTTRLLNGLMYIFCNLILLHFTHTNTHKGFGGQSDHVTTGHFNRLRGTHYYYEVSHYSDSQNCPIHVVNSVGNLDALKEKKSERAKQFIN